MSCEEITVPGPTVTVTDCTGYRLNCKCFDGGTGEPMAKTRKSNNSHEWKPSKRVQRRINQRSKHRMRTPGPDERTSPTSVQAASAGLPTLGKRR